MLKLCHTHFWINTRVMVKTAFTCSSVAPSSRDRSSLTAWFLVNPTSPKSKRVIRSTSRAVDKRSTFTKVGFPLPLSISPTLWSDNPARSASCSWVKSFARRKNRILFPKSLRVSPMRPSFWDSLGKFHLPFKQAWHLYCLIIYSLLYYLSNFLYKALFPTKQTQNG